MEGIFTVYYSIVLSGLESISHILIFKDFYNYIMPWIKSRMHSSFVFLWTEVENYLELPLGSPWGIRRRRKVARDPASSGSVECPAVCPSFPTPHCQAHPAESPRVSAHRYFLPQYRRPRSVCVPWLTEALLTFLSCLTD